MNAVLRGMLAPTSRVRGVADLAWLGSFAVIFTVLVLRTTGASSPGSREMLDMLQGAQRQGVYFGTSRVGTLQTVTRRTAGGWEVSSRFIVGDEEAASMRLSLYSDLSLAGLRVQADLRRLLLPGVGGLTTFAHLLWARMEGTRQVEVEGRCAIETGICQVQGRIAGKLVSLPVTAGRGPVLTSAIYPLLARGTLGRKAELGIFDPLALKRRILTFEMVGEERLTLQAGTFDTVKIQRDLAGMASHVWVDRHGRVIKETMPLGLSLEHEAFLPLKENAP